MSNFSSFEPMLRQYLRVARPASIIEWGPGLSTSIMLEECPDARIVSFEHNLDWLKKSRAKLGNDPRVRLVHQPACRKKSVYATDAMRIAAEQGPFDFAFVDGRRRVECVLVALSIVRQTGAIMLHDADRWHYRLPIAPLVHAIADEGHTMLFIPKPGIQWTEQFQAKERKQ